MLFIKNKNIVWLLKITLILHTFLSENSLLLSCIVAGSRRLICPRMHCSRRLIVQTLVFSRSYLHRQVSPPETLVVKGGTAWARNGRWILPENARLPRNIQGSFACLKSKTWDNRLYFPSEGRLAENFFDLKNPMASAGFEPEKLAYQRPARYLWEMHAQSSFSLLCTAKK